MASKLGCIEHGDSDALATEGDMTCAPSPTNAMPIPRMIGQVILEVIIQVGILFDCDASESMASTDKLMYEFVTHQRARAARRGHRIGCTAKAAMGGKTRNAGGSPQR
jgi:hypothetical protein